MAHTFTCYPLITLPQPTTLYEYMFSATSIVQPSDTALSELKHFTSSFRGNELGAVIPEGALLTQLRGEYGPDFTLDSFFQLDSIYSKACFMVAISGAYRVLNITSVSLQHKITNSNWRPSTKWAANTMVAMMPYLIMHALGYPATELLMASALRSVSTYVFSTRCANFIKELDLVSGTEKFSLYDFGWRNLLNSIRNLVSVLGLDVIAMMRGWASPLLRLEAGIEVCYSLAGKMLRGYSMNLLPYIHMTNELGWFLGKASVDLAVVGLYQAGIVKDLRDPFEAMLQGFFPSQPVFKEKKQKSTPSPKKTERSDFAVPMSSLPSGSMAITPASQPFMDYTSGQRLPSKRIEKQKRTDEQENVLPQPAPKSTLDYREALKVVDYDNTLVPLNGQGITGLNLWGVVDSEDPDRQKIFQTALNAGRVGEGKNIKRLQGSDNQYEIRPQSLNQRVIGTLVKGKKEVYDAIKEVYGYERAKPIVDQMSAGHEEEVAAIVFKKETKHKGIAATMRGMAATMRAIGR